MKFRRAIATYHLLVLIKAPVIVAAAPLPPIRTPSPTMKIRSAAAAIRRHAKAAEEGRSLAPKKALGKKRNSANSSCTIPRM